MSGDIVNLNTARKAKTKVESAAKAAANRAAFGRTKAERTTTRDHANKAARTLDGHRLTPPSED